MKSFPIGIDIGTTRVRLAHTVMTDNGPRLRAIVTREVSSGVATSGPVPDADYVGALLAEAREELQTKERRCVIAVGEPHALLRAVAFPPMTGFERDSAAAFEAQRYVDYPVADAVVRIHPVNEKEQLYVLGVVGAATLASRVRAVKRAGLRLVAVDHEALALMRAFPGFDAVLDVGAERCSLHLATAETPVTLQHAAGGGEITRHIQRELSIDEHSAEKRKRIVGTAGAGEDARSTLLAGLSALLDSASVRTKGLCHVALVGNGSRLNGISTDLERSTGLLVETPVSHLLRGEHYPLDVVKASAPDWSLATALCVWGHGTA